MEYVITLTLIGLLACCALAGQLKKYNEEINKDI